MALVNDQNSIYDIKISTVVPGVICGNDAVQELTAMDLAMKLHYLRFVYYFKAPTFDGLTTTNIRETMYKWLNHAYIPCGRLRRSDSGRLFIKCNDCGVRLVEARCHKSLDEWLESEDDSRHRLLVPNHVIGPDLSVSPLVMIQLTKFKCGATSIGMSWSHMLGDVFSAMRFIKLWFQVIEGNCTTQPLTMAKPETTTLNIQTSSPNLAPLSIKRVNLIGDLWSTLSNSTMETFSFYLSMTELTQLQAKICEEKASPQIPTFECISIVIWKCLAKTRHVSGSEAITICKGDLRNQIKEIMTNKSQTIGVIKTNTSITEYNMMQLGLLIMNEVVDERIKIEEAIERDDKLSDFLMYGTNLTFVDFGDVSLYEMEVRGQKPVYVNCVIDNINDKGVIVVLPSPTGCSHGRIVSITLPKNKMVELKAALKDDWCIT
ncbi:hypothetical protein L1887_18727 [Cichorium endivia]|nr:hypothetical protein L1887_18727 [Cichorium endivia]